MRAELGKVVTLGLRLTRYFASPYTLTTVVLVLLYFRVIYYCAEVGVEEAERRSSDDAPGEPREVRGTLHVADSQRIEWAEAVSWMDPSLLPPLRVFADTEEGQDGAAVLSVRLVSVPAASITHLAKSSGDADASEAVFSSLRRVFGGTDFTLVTTRGEGASSSAHRLLCRTPKERDRRRHSHGEAASKEGALCVPSASSWEALDGTRASRSTRLDHGDGRFAVVHVTQAALGDANLSLSMPTRRAPAKDGASSQCGNRSRVLLAIVDLPESPACRGVATWACVSASLLSAVVRGGAPHSLSGSPQAAKTAVLRLTEWLAETYHAEWVVLASYRGRASAESPHQLEYASDSGAQALCTCVGDAADAHPPPELPPCDRIWLMLPHPSTGRSALLAFLPSIRRVVLR